MIEVIDKRKCSGCTACYSICPKNCIDMVADNEGFLYPKVNITECIDCGLCNKICPVINKKENIKNELPKAVITRSKDMDTVVNCASGGFGHELARYVVDNGGYVFGVKLDEKLRIVHSLTNKLEELNAFRGSKYVQSFLGDSFSKCEHLLKSDELVLFIGTPCQIAGLKAFLKKDYEKLITLDMVCHGVPSPMIWNKYLDFMEQKYKSEIKELNFRNKDYGYRSTCLKINFQNNKVYRGSPRVDIMLKGFYKDITNRPSCADCAFKTINHVSDFTCYDNWRAEQLGVGCKDDNKGYTNVFIQSDKAQTIISNMKYILDLHDIDVNMIIPKDGDMILNSAKEHDKREKFWESIDSENYEIHLTKFVSITKKDKIIEKTKMYLANLGILEKISKAKRRKNK